MTICAFFRRRHFVKVCPGFDDTSDVSDLKARVQAAHWDALQAKNDLAVATFHQLGVAILDAEARWGVRPLDDANVARLVADQVRSLAETIEQFREKGQLQLARRTLDRLALLAPYMPAQCSDDELQGTVRRLGRQVTVREERDRQMLSLMVLTDMGARVDVDRVSLAIEELYGPGPGSAALSV